MMPSSSHPRHHILDGTIRVFLAEMLCPLTGIITAAFLTRRLGPEGYGLLTLAATLVVWVQWTISALFSRATIKWIGEAKDWRPVGASLMRLHLALSTGAAILLWLLAPGVAGLLNEPVLGTYLRLFVLDIPLWCLAHVHRNILVGIGSFSPRAVVSAGRWVARLLLIILLVEMGLSVEGAILGSIGASFIELIIARCYIRPSLSRSFDFPARQLWSDAVPLFLLALSLTLYNKLDLFILKGLGASASQAGIYGAAQNLSMLPGIFSYSFAPLLLSTLSRLLRTGENHLAREMGRDAMRVTVMLLPFAALMAAAANEIVDIIFGSLFLPAGPLLAVLIFGTWAQVMISVTTALLTAASRPGSTFALIGPLVPLAIIGHLILIPWLGALGACLVTTLLAGLGALAAVLYVYSLWQIFPPLATLLRSALLCVVAYALAVLWSAPGILLFLKLPVIGLIICFSFLLLGEFSTSEMALARSMMRWRAVPERNPSQV